MKLEVVNGLTQFTRDSIGEFNKRMIITFTNDGWVKKDGIDAYIDNEVSQGINLYEWDRNLALAIGEYWKYVFHVCEDNILEEDKELAMKCLKKSYKLGSGDAAAQLGYYYYTGTGIVDSPNKKKSKKLFVDSTKKVSFMSNCIIAKAFSTETENLAAQMASADGYELSIKQHIPFDKDELACVYSRIIRLMSENNDDRLENYANKALQIYKLDEEKYKDELEKCNAALKRFKKTRL